MSILNPIPAATIFREFTHKGWFFACPVYINLRSSDCFERNGIPAFWFNLNLAAFEAAQFVRFMIGLERWPGFPLRVGERIGTGATR